MAENRLTYDRSGRSVPPLYKRSSFLAWTAIVVLGTLIVLGIASL